LIARKIVPQADDCPAIGLADTLSLPAAPIKAFVVYETNLTPGEAIFAARRRRPETFKR
jgi:hypothetical protein